MHHTRHRGRKSHRKSHRRSRRGGRKSRYQSDALSDEEFAEYLRQEAEKAAEQAAVQAAEATHYADVAEDAEDAEMAAAMAGVAEDEDRTVRMCTQFLAQRNLLPATTAAATAATATTPVGATHRRPVVRNFINEGHTCYISSSLQALASIPQLVRNMDLIRNTKDPFLRLLATTLQEIYNPQAQTPQIPRSVVSRLAHEWNKRHGKRVHHIDPHSDDDPDRVVFPFVERIIEELPALSAVLGGSVMSNGAPDAQLIVMLPAKVTKRPRRDLLTMLGDWSDEGNRIYRLGSVVFIWFATPHRISVPRIIDATQDGSKITKRMVCRSIVCFIPDHYVAYVVKPEGTYLCNDVMSGACRPMPPTADGTIPYAQDHTIKLIVYSEAGAED